MSALFTQLERLKVNTTPIEDPLPPDMHTPGASSTPSQYQAFIGKEDLRYIAHDPALVESIIGVFKDRLQEHPAAAAGTFDSTTTDAVRSAISEFENNDYRSYRESEIESGAVELLSAVMKLVAALDVLLGVPNAVGAKILRQYPLWIPETSSDPRAQYIPDLTLCRLVRDDPAARTQWHQQTTIELKLPAASKNWFDPSAGAGLFVRAIHFVQSKSVCKFDELPEDLKSLLQKEIVAARFHDNDLFFFLDNFTWFIGLVVPTGEGSTYDVLLSDLQLVAPHPPSPNRLVLLHGRLPTPPRRFRRGWHRYARLGPACGAPPAIEEVAEDAEAVDMENLGRGRVGRILSLDDATLTDEVHIVFPSGRSIRATRSLASPSRSLSSSHSSRASDISHVSSSPTTSMSPSSPVSLSPQRSPSHSDHKSHPKELVLESFVGDGSTSQVFSLMLGDEKHVLKVTNRKVEGDVEEEIERLLELQSQPALADTVVPLRAVYRDADGRPMLLMPFAGEALEDWSSLTKEQRVALVVALMRLHQIGHIQHNDIAPRNVVVSTAPGAQPRIIDFTSAAPGHECCSGSNCHEVNMLIHELHLKHDADLEEIGRKAAAEGLKW
ncbi:hypothetical protein JCM3770_006174 [Rhodotorula araucariae]